MVAARRRRQADSPGDRRERALAASKGVTVISCVHAHAKHTTTHTNTPTYTANGLMSMERNGARSVWNGRANAFRRTTDERTAHAVIHEPL